MNIGDNVRVNKCDCCEAVVGKIGRIKSFVNDDNGDTTYPLRVVLNFGRGRPQAGRPEFFPIDDLANVSDPIAEVNV